MLSLILLAPLIPPPAATDPLIDTYRAMTAAEKPCVFSANATDITVCGRRNADRFRVPFVTRDPDDPRNEPVGAERARLLNRRTPVQELSPFLVGGGQFGLTMTAGGGHGPVVEGARPPAP